MGLYDEKISYCYPIICILKFVLQCFIEINLDSYILFYNTRQKVGNLFSVLFIILKLKRKSRAPTQVHFYLTTV